MSPDLLLGFIEFAESQPRREDGPTLRDAARALLSPIQRKHRRHVEPTSSARRSPASAS